MDRNTETVFEPCDRRSVQRYDFVGLQTFGPVGDDEFNFLAFLDGPVAIDFDGAVMKEDVSSGSPFDEPVALGIVEPLDFASFFLGHFFTTFFLVETLSMQVSASTTL